MTIRWHDRVFEGPFHLSYWEPPKKPALYAIMLKPDQKNDPNAYRIIFFGHTANLTSPIFYKNHKKLKCWKNLAGQIGDLHVGYHIMLKSTIEARDEAVSGLIDHYKPICNF